jgi:hypothetical protein
MVSSDPRFHAPALPSKSVDEWLSDPYIGDLPTKPCQYLPQSARSMSAKWPEAVYLCKRL